MLIFRATDFASPNRIALSGNQLHMADIERDWMRVFIPNR
jgi:hypothetical protein